MSFKNLGSAKQRTSSFQASKNMKSPTLSSHFGYSPGKSDVRSEKQDTKLKERFMRKDLRNFEPHVYVTGALSVDDVIDLKEVFDSYDQTGIGVLLPNDLKLLLTQNGFQPSRDTVYETLAEFDVEQTGGISFNDFLRVMECKPFRRENKKEIAAVFKKYDRSNKGYLALQDLREMNRHLKENMNEETLRLMLEKADSNNDGKISFEDFYNVMVKDMY